MAICSLCKKNMNMYEAPTTFVELKGYSGCMRCSLLVRNLHKAVRDNDETAIDKACDAISKISKDEKFLEIALETYKKNNVSYQKAQQIQAISMEEKIKRIKKIREIPVTTTDIEDEYEVIAPIIYNTTNKGIFSSAYDKLKTRYLFDPFKQLLVKPDELSFVSGDFGTWFLSLLDGSATYEGGVGQGEFDNAFYYCVAEMKLRCAQMGGDAIVGLRMDYDLDTVNFGAFYLQMYGTVVKFKNKDNSIK